MRKPSKHELWKLDNLLKGLTADIEALGDVEASGASLSDVLGTMGVNLKVLTTLHERLTEESEA